MVLTAVISHCTACFQVDGVDVHVGLGDLVLVVDLKHGIFQFIYASPPDFLLDPGRAQNFYIDSHMWNARVALLALQGMEKEGKRFKLYRGMYLIIIVVRCWS